MKKITWFLLLMLTGIDLQAQVNLQTGSAVFSLPVFNWQDDKSRLSSIVALDYSSGNGLKVNNVASNAGEGWNLIQGGMITRMQVGEPDDQLPYFDHSNGNTEQDNDVTKYPAGYLYATIPAINGCPRALARYPLYKARNVLYRQHNVTVEDRQLDYFSFQFNGKTGMFVIDTTNGGTGWPLGDTKMKISFQRDETMIHNDANSPRTTITSFTIQDVDGLIYKFTVHGMSKVLEQDFCNKNEAAPEKQPRNFDNRHVYFQSGFENSQYKNPWIIDKWCLSEIDDPLTGRKIIFNYTTRTTTSRAGVNITYHHPDKEYVIVSYKPSVTKTPEISSIIYPDGHTVTFTYGTVQRPDLPGEYPLASIDIQYNGRYLSEYGLDTKYFILNRYGTPVTDYEKRVARLCLLSVRKIGVDRKEDSPPYLFDYYLGDSNGADDFVPPPFFYAHDIWGYYNGDASKSYDGSSIPVNKKTEDLNFDQLKGLCFLKNGVASPVLNPKTGYAKNGLLKQVIYPTGGTLIYQYAQNTGKLPAGSSDVQVGGVHVSQTNSTDGGYQYGCDNPLVTHYNYTLANGHSSLWGLENPENYSTMHIHYEPESKGFHIHNFSPECFWRYQYPGIQSQYEAVGLSFSQRAMQAVGPALGFLSTLGTVLDIVKYTAGATGPVWIIADVAAIVLNTVLSCVSSNIHRYDHPVYYNMDLNGISPLPTQFKRVEIVQGDGAAGKTVETFTSDDDYPLWVPAGQNRIYSAKQRYAPWAYGLPRLVDVYDANGHLLKETENVYDTANARRCLNQASQQSSFMALQSNLQPNLSLPSSCNDSIFVSCNCEVFKTNSQRSDDWTKKSQHAGDDGYDDPDTYYNDSNLPPDSILGYDIYRMYTGRVGLRTSYERTYQVTDPSKYVQARTDYFYNSTYNYEVNNKATYKSDGEIVYTYFTYSSDYNGSGGVFNTLKQNNIISLPVETYTSVLKPNVSVKFLGDKVTEYTQLPNGDIRPYRTLEQRFAQPQSSISLYVPGGSTSGYKVTQSFTYDAAGNLIGAQDEGAHQLSYIRGYQDKYVVATIVNANPLTDKPAYTSFEINGELGGWTLNGSAAYVTTQAITGTRSLALSSGVTLTALLNTAKAYTLSFWTTSSNVSVSGGATRTKSAPAYNGFTYYEYSIPQGASSVTVSGTAHIDELRLFPSNARMQTTTYDPLIGKTSECDENNRITYYDYDNLGRLRFVKDEKKNVVKMYEYNNISAARQQGCPATYYNHAISEVFTRNNCGTGTVADTNLYTYTIPASKYSSTISQSDADARAQEELLTSGQAAANANSPCIAIYHNQQISVTDSTESCAAGYKGGLVTYTVPAGRYSSFISQADANAQAQEEADANAAWYANDPVHAACVYDSDPDWETDYLIFQCQTVLGGDNTGVQEVLLTDMNPNSPTYGTSEWKSVGTNLISCLPPSGITNGDFEQGALHFGTDYQQLSPGQAGYYGSYIVTSNSRSSNPGFCNTADHSSSGTNMMVVDGSENPDDRFWYNGIQIHGLQTYTLSFYVLRLDSYEAPTIEVRINGTVVLNQTITPTCSWQHVQVTWTASLTDGTALIEMRATSGTSIGNDFAIDDISFY